MVSNWILLLLLVSWISPTSTLSPRYKSYIHHMKSNLLIPADFIPDTSFGSHRQEISHVIFTVAMGNYSKFYLKDYFGTLSKTSYTGDVVIAINQPKSSEFYRVMSLYHPVVYHLPYCDPSHQIPSTSPLTIACSFTRNGHKQIVSINMIRYLFYQWWASYYSENTVILVTDFRDVIFQSNPFLYMPETWSPPAAQLTFFLEPLPQKMIYRCIYNSGWIRSCYGNQVYESLKMNPVSCSGTVLGSKNGIMVYSDLMIQQLNYSYRQQFTSERLPPHEKHCISNGMDQGFHNWLLYSGTLTKMMNVKVFHQGEGPINNIGAFYPGHQALVKFDLIDQWKILRGEKGSRYVSNWNGDPSPVVHQLDRYMYFLFIHPLIRIGQFTPTYMLT